MRRVDGRILRTTGWDRQIHTAFQQRRGNHEYDEQHKSEIEQRRDIDLAQCGEILALRITSHLRKVDSRAPGSTYLCSNSDASSAAKLSISTMIPRMLVTRKLYPNIAGIATQSAVTVVISAPDTPGAIETRFGEPASATPVKASITPQTVPSKPRKGEPLTAVAGKII